MKKKGPVVTPWLYFDDGYHKHRVRRADYERLRTFPGNMIESHRTTPDGDRYTAYGPVESLGKPYTP